MKIISTADLHYDRDRQEEFFKSAECLLETAYKEKPDLITIAGDIFDRATNNTESSGFPRLEKWFKALADCAPVAVIYGTPTHDIPGSLEFLEDIEAGHKITICRAGQVNALEGGKIIPACEAENPEILIFGIPEVSKGWLLANKNDPGGDTTEAVKDALKKYLLGLAALRQDFSDSPCLVLYHGAIKGASLSDTQTLPPGGIELSADDLAMIGADYYSCGHIHMRQELPGLPGMYEGSIYPKTWGETEQKAFSVINLVSGGWTNGFKERFYPHPPRVKISVDYEYIARDPDPSEYVGKHAWVEVVGKSADLAEFSAGGLLKAIEADGALPGSRVTTRIIRSETTRAAEITEAKTTYGKVRVWAENTGVEIPEDAEEKILVLDAESERRGLLHQPRKWRLDRLELRGAIGLWKGQKKEQIIIDFASLDPGTVALLGDNGAGKSTIVKNCNPYPEPIGGERKYQDLFFLRDSYSVTYWTDTITGNQYKASKLIDGKNASGKTEFFLYRMNGQGWEPYNEETASGRKAAYETAVLELFGTPEIFTRSAYIAQGGAELPNTPKGRKEFFNELLGNEYLEVMSGSAKERADRIEKDIDSTLGRVDGLKYGLDEEAEIQSRAEEISGDLSRMRKTILEVEIRGKEARATLDIVKKEQAENERILHEIGSLERAISDNHNQVAELERQVVAHKAALQGVPGAESRLQADEEARAELREYRDKKIGLDNHNLEARKAWQNACDEIRGKRDALRKELQEAERQATAITRAIDTLENEDRNLQQKAGAINTPCPNCGYLADDIKGMLEEIEHRRAEIAEEITAASASKEEWEVQRDGLQKDLAKIVDPPEPAYLDMDAPTITVISESDRKALERRIEEGRTASAQIAAKTEQVAILQEKIKTDKAVLAEKQETVDLFIDEKVRKAEAEYEDLRDRHAILSGSVAALEAEAKGLEVQLGKIRKQREEITRLESEIAEKRRDLATWRFLQRALGRDGVQALELDALAPNIAEVANRLLEKSYGSRFEIEFRTTRDAGTGKGRHQVEDFEIYVHDHEETEPALQTQTIGTMSGGERVWIMKALCDAFGIVRERNTGLQYMTTFQDEADGALSPEKKHLYLSMVEAAHAESGRHHTVYITHDAAIQDAIPQQIKVREL